MSQLDDLNSIDKERMLPIDEALENHYLLYRKQLVDKMQEIETNMVKHAENTLLIESLRFVKDRTEAQLKGLENHYFQQRMNFISYVTRLSDIAGSKGFYSLY